MKNYKISLAGDLGSGKSTVGVLLAKALGYRFLDCDLLIQEREGMLLDKENIIGAMNTDYIPIRFKDGQIEEKSKKYLYSMDRWRSMMGELEEVVTNVAERIKRGEIKAISAVSERSDKCDYCEFKPICRIKEL